MTTAIFVAFAKLDIRVDTIVATKNFEKAKKPTYSLEIDIGAEIDIKKLPPKL